MTSEVDQLAQERTPEWRAVNHPKALQKFAVVRGYPGMGIEFVKDAAGVMTFPTPFAAAKYAERLKPMSPRSAAQLRAAFQGFMADLPKPPEDLLQQLIDLEAILRGRARALGLWDDGTPPVVEEAVQAPLLGISELLLVLYAFQRNPAYGEAQKVGVLVELADAAQAAIGDPDTRGSA